MTADPKKRARPFSSTEATLKWARGVWGDEAVTNASYWLSFGIWSDTPPEDAETARPRRRGPGGVRKDLYGFIDVLALDGLPGLLALQACGTDVSEHKRKMTGAVNPRKAGDPKKLLKEAIDAAKLAGRVRRWLAAGNRILIVSWRDAWVGTSERHKVRKKAPRFVECRLEEPPPGMTLGLSDREVIWIEHETWPPIAAGRD